MTPATPRGVLSLLNHYDIKLQNKKVVIIGNGKLVGKPLATMLSDLKVDFETLDSNSKSLDATKKADILICAAGSPHLIKKEDIKEGAVVVDIGISDVKGTIIGDVDFDDIKHKASYISPTIGGVGPMTVVSLFENMLDTLEKQQ
jgi:methylenetetrahydrofolate dehydrogenase (NADP+)/methenyltetrahydrofolate cyclohydrolase